MGVRNVPSVFLIFGTHAFPLRMLGVTAPQLKKTGSRDQLKVKAEKMTVVSTLCRPEIAV